MKKYMRSYFSIAPKWNNLKNFEIVDKIDKKLTEKNTWQGKYYQFIE